MMELSNNNNNNNNNNNRAMMEKSKSSIRLEQSFYGTINIHPLLKTSNCIEEFLR